MIKIIEAKVFKRLFLNLILAFILICANIDKVKAANKFSEILSGIWYPALNPNIKNNKGEII